MDSLLFFRCKTRTYWNGYLWLEYHDPTDAEALPEHVERGRTNGGVDALQALEVPHHFVCESPEVEAIRKEWFKWLIGTGRKPGEGAQLDPDVQDVEIPLKMREYGRKFLELGGPGADKWEKMLADDAVDEIKRPILTEGLSDDVSVMTVAELRKALKDKGIALGSSVTRGELQTMLRKELKKAG